MTDFYKIVDDGYIIGFGTNGNESTAAITEEEYNDLADFFKTRPAAPSGKAYIMRDNHREWVLVDAPIDDADLDDSELVNILLGGGDE